MTTEADRLLGRIREQRSHIHRLVWEKSSLTDPEVLEVSRMLDTLLNEFGRMTMENGANSK